MFTGPGNALGCHGLTEEPEGRGPWFLTCLPFSLASQKDCLQNSLCESEARYGTELAQMQSLISTVEEQLSEIRADLERQNQEYQVLLDVRARLEGEISTYQKLLESEDCKLPCNPCATPASSTLGPAPAACTSCSSCLSRPLWASCGPCSSPQC